jgi:hypothetical protein
MYSGSQMSAVHNLSANLLLLHTTLTNPSQESAGLLNPQPEEGNGV